MAFSKLDPKTALIVIDLQKGIVTLPEEHDVKPVIQKARELADAFRWQNLPVILVNVAGGAPGRTERKGGASGDQPHDWTDLLPELKQQPSDHLVTKKTWGAFSHTCLDELLTRLGVTRIFPKLGETGTTQDVIGILNSRA